MTRAEAQRKNRDTTRRFERSLVTMKQAIILDALPQAMEEAGKAAVAHAQSTHVYENITGDLERSTSFAIVQPNETGSFEYQHPDGSKSHPVVNDSNQVLLVLGAGMDYARHVELTNGRDVVIQTVIKMRNEFGKFLSGKLRAFRIKP